MELAVAIGGPDLMLRQPVHWSDPLPDGGGTRSSPLRWANIMSDYQNDYWPVIYDQHHSSPDEAAFYLSEARAADGPVLEIACGTGLILLQMLEQGVDAYGIDISRQMLTRLRSKALDRQFSDVDTRVSRQDMRCFELDCSFAAVFIPARSFLHLPTQEAQIQCLECVREHLAPDGRLILNFFAPRLDILLRYSTDDTSFEERGRYVHPETRDPIILLCRQRNDLSAQRQDITWRFEHQGKQTDTSMVIRWIYKPEFELLARLAGFEVVALYGGYDRSAYTGADEMIWTLTKKEAQHGMEQTAVTVGLM